MKPIVTMMPASENGGAGLVILRIDGHLHRRTLLTPDEARSLAEALRVAAEEAEK